MKKKPAEMNENELLWALLSDKVGAIDANKVFYYKEGTNAYYLGGKKLTDTQAKTIKAEAGAILQTGIFKIICETLRHEAHERMFTKMQTLEDQHYGKTMLHSVGIFEKVIKALADMQLSTSPKGSLM